MTGRRPLAFRLAALTFAGSLLALLATAAWHHHQSGAALRRYPPPGRLIALAPDLRLHLNCQGQGSPTVIFEAGMSGWSADWARVQRNIAADTRACAYDRAGYGWSDPALSAVDAGSTAHRLRKLLRVGGVEPPFVLIGHSLGGLYAQAFAERFPADVAGLVLVDSVHRRQSSSMSPAMRHAYERRLVRLTSALATLAPTGLARLAGVRASVVAARLDPEDRAAAVALAYRSSSYRALREEMAAFRSSQAQVGPLPRTLPLTVLAATDLRDYPPGFGAGEKRIWDSLQRAHRPGGNAVVRVAGSGHYIHLDRPERVVEAIRTHLVKSHVSQR